MDAQTILLADPSTEITGALAQALRSSFRTVCCHDGAEFQGILDREQPDLVIMELSLPRVDGVELLRQLSRRECRPLVLVYSAANTDYLLGALRSLPVDYLLRKPMPVARVAERAAEMLALQSGTAADWQTSDLLIRLGLVAGSQGFRHLEVGLPLMAEQTEQFLGKTLYLEIARRNRVTAESVEKAIRDAIRTGWKRGDRALWQQYFPGITKEPQNKLFLTRMAAILSRYRRCG